MKCRPRPSDEYRCSWLITRASSPIVNNKLTTVDRFPDLFISNWPEAAAEQSRNLHTPDRLLAHARQTGFAQTSLARFVREFADDSAVAASYQLFRFAHYYYC